MTEIILCIFGSRSIPNEAVAHREILAGIRELGIAGQEVAYIIEGGAPGMDEWGHTFAAKYDLPAVTREAAWADVNAPGAVIRYGKHGPYNVLAGHWRNGRMAEEGTHFVGVRDRGRSTGTDDMIDRVRSLKKPLAIRRL